MPFRDDSMAALTLDSTDQDVDAVIDRLAASPADRLRLLQRLLGDGPCRQLGIYPIPPHFSLSVVIPVFNERQWIRELVRRVDAVPIPKEIVLVDDCSTDGTREILRELESNDNIRVFCQ